MKSASFGEGTGAPVEVRALLSAREISAIGRIINRHCRIIGKNIRTAISPAPFLLCWGSNIVLIRGER